MARTVRDTAIMLGGMVGVDPEDAVTAGSAGHFDVNYTQFLDADGLKGAPIVVAREYFGGHPGGDALIEACIKIMKEHGAEFFDVIEGRSGLRNVAPPVMVGFTRGRPSGPTMATFGFLDIAATT